MEGGGAYGSGGATGAGFDFSAYIRKPHVILRIVSLIFSVVVFGCISSQAFEGGRCAYQELSACQYGIAVGVLAFLGLLIFLALDGVFDTLSNVEQRKYIVIADIIFSGLWSFLWFICFCLFADKWRTQDKTDFHQHKSGIEAAIAFSFFSIPTFVALTVLAILRYRTGVSDDFIPEYDPNTYGGTNPEQSSGSAPYQSSSDYTQSPFTSPDSKPLPGGYQQQTY